MAQFSFCCANPYGMLLHRRTVDVTSLVEAREFAKVVIRLLIDSATLRDWRSCRLHVFDPAGDEVFVMPFWSILGTSAMKPATNRLKRLKDGVYSQLFE